jgi:hypothetical protein
VITTVGVSNRSPTSGNIVCPVDVPCAAPELSARDAPLPELLLLLSPLDVPSPKLRLLLAVSDVPSPILVLVLSALLRP